MPHTPPTPDPVDWSRTTFDGNRRRQHEAFLALPLREKLARIEQMGEVAAHFASGRGAIGRAGGTPMRTAYAGGVERAPGTENG